MKSGSPRISRSIVLSAAVLASVCSAELLWAEQWSDTTGKFQIDAEYVRVEGKSVLLRKPDGSTLTVPINRLSAASRERAKQLFSLAKSGGSAPAPAPAMPDNTLGKLSTYSPPTTYAAIDAPAVPPITAMPAFPNEPSLEEQVTFLREQAMAGHLEVFWYALPDEMRAAIDSQEFRSALRPQMKEYESQGKPMQDLVSKLLNVLTTKKEFVLGTSMLAAVPAEAKGMLTQGYDSGVGAFYEMVVFSDAQTALPDHSMSSIIDYHAPRIGAHLSQLIGMLPAEQVDGFVSKISVEQIDDNSGTITVPGNGGTTKTIDMARVEGRWIPRDLADQWVANKDSLTGKIEEMMQTGQQLGNSPEAKAQVEAITGQVDVVLDGMLAANNQQEFDNVLMGVFNQAMMMFGGGFGAGGPGGPPAGF